MRSYSLVDSLVGAVDNALRTLSGGYQTTNRKNPADLLTEADLSEQEQRQIAGLMRINHCGEVCAQALYQGQALTAKLPEVREQMAESAKEENDHLAWCDQRLVELNTHSSWLNPIWYASSFTIGALAGLAGDKWSLGFVVETEHQVVKHLENHLNKLPEKDLKTKAILKLMQEDEAHHAAVAKEAGGAELPAPIKIAMSNIAKVMTKTVYYI